MTSMQFSMAALQQAGVALTPGIDFGPGGEGYVRLSYANSIEKIDLAIQRLSSSGLL